MKKSIQSIVFLFFIGLITAPLNAQTAEKPTKTTSLETDFADRKAILKTIENFYIGDHTGSVEHMKLSMHPKGAYRYTNRDGDYAESIFDLNSDDADPHYKEELLSIEIYDKLAIARLRLKLDNREGAEYKLMTMHKANNEWKITSINWGFGVTQ